MIKYLLRELPSRDLFKKQLCYVKHLIIDLEEMGNESMQLCLAFIQSAFHTL